MKITIEIDDVKEFIDFLEFQKSKEDFLEFQKNKEYILQKKNKEKQNIPISQCGFGTRIINALTSLNVQTIEDIGKIPEQHLLKTRHFGRGSLNKIKKYCWDNKIPLY